MRLFIRLVRALAVFGTIFGSYMVQLGLVRLFRRWEHDAASGREVSQMPEWLSGRQRNVDERNAQRLLQGMIRLRGCYIKLGQVLSIMGGFLPAVYGRELEALQDSVPPRPFSEIEQAFRQSLGSAPEVYFESIEPDPIAAASLGQVHVATLPGGEKVAVKVLYPGIREVVRTDMKVVKLALRVYKWFVPVNNIEVVHDSLVDLLRRETDYLHEARCMARMAADFANDDYIVFPEVVDEVTTRDVLTMTFMDGIKISHVDEIRARGVDPEKLARRLIKSFYKQVFMHRFFHADPHPGNFLVQPVGDEGDARIVVLDFGAISEVEQGTVDGMLDVLRGFFEHKDALVLSGIEQIGFMAKDGDRALLERTTKRYFEKLLKLESRTPGALMRANSKELEALADPEVERRELRRLMRSVHYPDGWFYVERASVMMFWLAGQIAPEIDSLKVGLPYVMPLLSARISGQKSEPPPRVSAALA